jgi:hypothetical protein
MTYGARGNELTYLNKEWQDSLWTNSSLDSMTYDTSGNELTYLAEYWQNGQWTNSSLNTYTYNASGNQLTDSCEYWQNGQWTNQWLETYTYDINQNLIDFSSESWQDSAWVASDGDMWASDGPNYEDYYGYDVTIAYKLTNVTGISVSKPNIPTGFSLSQNYPNPFNPATVINYQLPVGGFVTLKVYDILGREVTTLVNGRQNAGYYHAKFDGSRLASGVYFYRLMAGDYTSIKKAVLMK